MAERRAVNAHMSVDKAALCAVECACAARRQAAPLVQQQRAMASKMTGGQIAKVRERATAHGMRRHNAVRH